MLMIEQSRKWSLSWNSPI